MEVTNISNGGWGAHSPHGKCRLKQVQIQCLPMHWINLFYIGSIPKKNTIQLFPTLTLIPFFFHRQLDTYYLVWVL